MTNLIAALRKLVLSLLLISTPMAAMAAGYDITGPLKGKNRPDLPCCTPFVVWYTPSISGDYVVFTSRNGPPDGVWSYRISTGKLRKLAGLTTRVPGGSGKFASISAAGTDFQTLAGGDHAIFFGRDGAGRFGLYSVPLAGGAVKRIVSTRLRIPGQTELFSDLRRASTNGKTVAFWGNGPGNISGIYQAGIDGSGLKRVIDSRRPLDARSPNGPSPDYYTQFGLTTVGKSAVQFTTSGLFDPVSGPSAIFRSKAGGFADLADNMTALQSGTAGQHVRISGMSAAPGSAAMAFLADEPGTGYTGLFRVKSLNAAAMFVSTKTVVPGTSARFGTFPGFGYDDSGLAFTATHMTAAGAVQGVYVVTAPGKRPVLIASSRRYYLPIVGERSISGGRVVFMENTNYAETFYLATPKP